MPKFLTLMGVYLMLKKHCASCGNGNLLSASDFHDVLKRGGITSVSTRKRYRRQLTILQSLTPLEGDMYGLSKELPRIAQMKNFIANRDADNIEEMNT
ncbi:MAG: hypothetical protein EOO38_03865 [Cytophagaceae bacterium]|nr:MAG: hypothetical protein EOO38_03865 [Cytophagaceae bacterium]